MEGEQQLEPEHPSSLVISDRPLSDGAGFNFDSIIRTLYEFVCSAPEESPLNICLSGDWGSGKTTLLSGLEQRFKTVQKEREEEEKRKKKKDPQVRYVTIWFDPWKLDGEVEVRNSLARKVLDVIERDADFVTRGEIEIDRKNVLRMLGERLLRIDADKVSTLYKAESRTRETFVEVEAIFRKVADVYLNNDVQPRRLVVFIDDLDRCHPQRITEVLESIKLFFDLPGLIFVFALDRVQLEAAVAGKYNFSKTEARIYLEKMFQLDVPLPRKGTNELHEFLRENLLGVGVELADEKLLAAIVERFGRNLRNLKVFINNFSFQRKLFADAGDLREEDLHEEVLFKWIYLETTMSRSLTQSLMSGSPNLVVALELLAHGGFLHDEQIRLKYIRRLRRSSLNYVALVIYAVVSAQEEVKPPTAQITTEQQAIIEALQADGSVTSTLNVIREGSQLLVDADLNRMAFLARSKEIDTPLEAEPAEPSPDESNLNFNTLLTEKEWDSLGDDLLRANRNVDAYLCYTMASLIDPNYNVYTCDLGRTYRRFHQLEAAKALLLRAYAKEPSSPYIVNETAYLYDLDFRDEELGSALYRKAIACGTNGTIAPYYLALNLSKTGQLEEAYLACLDAVIRDPEHEGKQNLLMRYARETGRPDPDKVRSIDERRAELAALIQEGRYPLPVSEEDEQIIATRLAEGPDPEAANAELSRPLF